MSIRNLDALFDPDSIAVIGASPRIGSIGNTVWHKLASGSYAGKLYAVNPKYRELGAHAVVARASDLPCAPALAVICTPPPTVTRLVAELASHGTRAAVCSGFWDPGALAYWRRTMASMPALRPLMQFLGNWPSFRNPMD